MSSSRQGWYIYEYAAFSLTNPERIRVVCESCDGHDTVSVKNAVGVLGWLCNECGHVTLDGDKRIIMLPEHKMNKLKELLESEELREALASVQHDIWSHWMEYFFSCCDDTACEWIGGQIPVLEVPGDKVDRWKRQKATPYSELSEREKESDRDQADKVLRVLKKLLER
jgi:hypothetical protein